MTFVQMVSMDTQTALYVIVEVIQQNQQSVMWKLVNAIVLETMGDFNVTLVLMDSMIIQIALDLLVRNT